MSNGFSASDHDFMARAIRLAKLGRYTTDPNPRVGCVIVKDGVVVGEGWHRKAGEPHAERNALSVAGNGARGATAYVTLEPCCHTGRTPPCTQGLIEGGVSRVVVAMVDPNPLVAGKGQEALRKAGIEVVSGLMEAEAEKLNPGFIKRMCHGMPYTRCKLAMSLDGRTAMASGESKWITSDEARRDVQFLRAGSSAIVTGLGTILADDPSMNVRLSASDLPDANHGLPVRQPLRVVLDAGLQISSESKILKLPGSVLVMHSSDNRKRQDELLQAGAELQHVTSNGHNLELKEVMQHLAQREINEVLIESGPTLAGAGLQSGIIDELVIYMAPHIMGDGARGLLRLPGLERMQDRIEVETRDIRQIGRDFRISAFPIRG